MTKQIINYTGIVKKLIRQRRVIGLLQFEVREKGNFAKWYSLTENLVIKAFGQKSNQLRQLRDLYYDMRSSGDLDFQIDKRVGVKEAKEKLKSLLTVFVEELKMATETAACPSRSARSRRAGTKNVLIATQTVNTNVSISQIIKHIKETEPDPEKAKEAETKLKELEHELKQKSPAWANVKGVLEWLLDFSRDAFLAVLPIILKHYTKQ